MYSASLPDDDGCEEVRDGDETLYICDGVLYRSTYYEGNEVYEIVSQDPNEEGFEAAEPGSSVLGMGLTSPMTSGQDVRDVQNRLVGAGYDVGGVDGVYGTGTETAVLWLQYDNDLEQSGIIDRPTAELLGFLPPSDPPPEATGEAETEATDTEQTETEATEASEATESDDASETEGGADAADGTQDAGDDETGANDG
ncbi:MAG: peptidoglycan-binding domain-containing protein [Pseudomonadota bacterium]